MQLDAHRVNNFLHTFERNQVQYSGGVCNSWLPAGATSTFKSHDCRLPRQRCPVPSRDSARSSVSTNAKAGTRSVSDIFAGSVAELCAGAAQVVSSKALDPDLLSAGDGSDASPLPSRSASTQRPPRCWIVFTSSSASSLLRSAHPIRKARTTQLVCP